MGEPAKPATSRTRWICAVPDCFAVYRERAFVGRNARRHPRDRLRVGVCPSCAVRARTALLAREHPAAAALAPLLERIGRRVTQRRP